MSISHNTIFAPIGGAAFVTGAGRGSGRAIAETLVSMGVQVVAADIREMEPIEGATSIRLDVSDEAAVGQAVEAGADGEPFQIVVNNAGVYEQAFFESHDTAVWNRMFAINVTAPFFIMRAASRILIERKLPGSFINLSSIAGTHAHRNCAGYCASKAAVLGLTRATALDLAPYDITVNSVCPGTVDTEMIREVAHNLTGELGLDYEGAWNHLIREIPLGRMQTTSEVAAAVCFLATKGARSISGTHLTLDGAQTAGS